MWEAGDLLPDLVLPLLTGSCAHGAKTVGGFGLVRWWLTNAYHVRDLGLNRSGKAFTNHYHRTGGDGGLGDDLGGGGVVRWLGSMVRVM